MQADWSKLEGKKVIIFGCESNISKVDIGVIVGCDPDIGICIADVGKVKPWFVVLGPSEPRVVNKKDSIWKSNRKLELEAIYKMLQSGYYSGFEDYNNEERIYGYCQSTGDGVGPTCPFSA